MLYNIAVEMKEIHWFEEMHGIWEDFPKEFNVLMDSYWEMKRLRWNWMADSMSLELWLYNAG